MKLPFNKRGQTKNQTDMTNNNVPNIDHMPKNASALNTVMDPSKSMQNALLSADVKDKPKNPSKYYQENNVQMLDLLSPQAVELNFDHLKIDDVYLRTLFVSGYPRFVHPGWLEQIINFDGSLDISFFIYPVEGQDVLGDLRHKVAEMEAEIATDLERGKILDPGTQAKLDDARMLQRTLVTGSEHFFEFGFYITIPARSLEELNHLTKQVQSTLGALLITSQYASLDTQNGFLSSLPFGIDRLNITRNMDTTSLATTFPLTSAELSSDRGILYGINPLNDSFIIFDRFSLENSNMTVFATSGAGKSLAPSEPVLYKKNGVVTLGKIGNLVDKTISKGQLVQLEKEIEGVIDPDLEVFTFDKNLNGQWSKVRVAARKNSPNNLFKITTKSGRGVKITSDHCLVVIKDGKVVTTKGKDVQVGNYIPLPRNIDNHSEFVDYIDTEKLLSKSGIKYIKSKGKRVGNRLFSLKTSIPKKFKLSSDFFGLLGLFTAEGMIIPTRASITNQNKQVLKMISDYYDSIGLAYSYIQKNNKQIGIYVSAQVFTEFLRLLGASGKANKKRTPPLVFNAPQDHVAKYLKAYFEGDGGVDGHEISATTKSKGLASDLSYLLLRFGIIARIDKTQKAATNTKAKTKRTYYRLKISGQENIRKYVNNIGFISERKNQLTKKLLKTGNTNVDIIPELGPILENIYEILYKSTEIPAPKNFSEIKLGIFKPSPANLLSLINKIEKRVSDIENLKSDDLSTLRNLPTTEEIISKGLQKTTKTKLWNALGKSWWTMKAKNPPKLNTTLQAISITHDRHFTCQQVGSTVYNTFKTTGESLIYFDKSLWDAINNKNANPLYQKVINARDFISHKYDIKLTELNEVKKHLNWLKILAYSDLFWDPIVKVEKIKSKDKYVYDLQVDNGVFLAGHGGMFVHNSYFVKLESVRSLMLGAEVVVIDPESEYKTLAEAVNGQNISFSFSSKSKINPFDLSQVYDPNENQLGLKILSLHSLFKVIMGELNPTQEALLDRALIMTYRSKGITHDPATQSKTPPLMEDLYKVLIGMETPEAMDLAARIEKFVKGSYVGIFDQQTNIDLDNPFTVFSVKELQDSLRPIAMFVILDYIWTRVKKDLKKRLMIVDEAWHMMRYEDSAQFLWSIVKRARKYYLGITTITQDVEDFLAQDIGKAVVTNSALRVLLKQSPAAIDKVGDVFYLSEGEKNLLLGANVGEGIFFAGRHHVPVSIVASPEEHKLITTNPEEIAKRRAEDPLKLGIKPELIQEQSFKEGTKDVYSHQKVDQKVEVKKQTS